MAKFVIDLTNPDDQPQDGLSFSSGRHGHTVEADGLDAAITTAVARSKSDGYFGFDWSAQIVALDVHGRRCLDTQSIAVVRLREGAERLW
jgi:hypothetical protein